MSQSISASRAPGIIIVNDVLPLSAVYEKYFKEAGLTVIGSFPGLVNLLEFLNRSKDDTGKKVRNAVILLDYGMPGTHSRDILETIRRIASDCKFLLAIAEYSSKADVHEEFYDAILRKPFTIGEFLTTLESLESRKELEGSSNIRGPDEIIKTVVDSLSRTTESISASLGSNSPIDLLSFASYANLVEEATSKKIRIQLITEITYENLSYCKELVTKFGWDIRHVDEAQSRFVLFDNNLLLSFIALKPLKNVPPTAIYSTVRSQVSHYRNLFDAMLEQSVTSEQKIRELETEISESRLSILTDPQESLRAQLDLLRNAKSFVVCWKDPRHFAMFLIPEVKETIQDAMKRGVRIKLITEINSADLDVCNELISIGLELRHFSGPTDAGFTANETEYLSPVSRDDERTDRPMMYCNFPFFVKRQISIFEALWSVAIPSSERVRQVGQGGSIGPKTNLSP